MAESVDDLAAISNAAREEAQLLATTSPDASINALREDEYLFQKAIRGKVLASIKIIINLFIVLFCLTVVIRFIHLLFPMWGWLNASQIEQVDKLLKSGLLITAGGIGKDVLVNSLPSKRT